MNHHKKRKHAGFTLVEVAIVIVIFGLLLSALLIPLQAQRNVAFQHQTEATLENAKQALLGFAQTKGRLPCPATDNGGAFPDGTGTANPSGSGACVQQVGFLPAKTLGILPTDTQGFALDAWNNRIRYAITIANTNAFTINNGMNNAGLATLAPDLRVCASTNAAQCTATVNLTNEAVAVIYSLGTTGAQASGGSDENENLDNDTIFVSHTPVASDPTYGEFDHIVTWISPYVLYNAMIQAGQLH